MPPDRAMTPLPRLPRTRSFHAPLVRCLEGLGVAATPESDRTVAEHLGEWLAWTDAIALFDVLQDDATTAVPMSPRAAAAQARAATDAADRAREELTRSISTDTRFAAAAVDAGTARGGCHAQQRAMEERLAPVRSGLRAALTARSPALGRLAALDALMERALAGKERQLLHRLPTLLEQPAAGEAGPARVSPTVDGAALRSALLAELDLRMQPIQGLIEALAAPATAPVSSPSPARPGPRAPRP